MEFGELRQNEMLGAVSAKPRRVLPVVVEAKFVVHPNIAVARLQLDVRVEAQVPVRVEVQVLGGVGVAFGCYGVTTM